MCRTFVCTDSSDNDIDYVASKRYPSEDSINKDEGIEVDVKRGNIKQEEGKLRLSLVMDVDRLVVVAN